jgi:hypothetical protein
MPSLQFFGQSCTDHPVGAQPQQRNARDARRSQPAMLLSLSLRDSAQCLCLLCLCLQQRLSGERHHHAWRGVRFPPQPCAHWYVKVPRTELERAATESIQCRPGSRAQCKQWLLISLCFFNGCMWYLVPCNELCLFYGLGYVVLLWFGLCVFLYLLL